MLAGFWNELYLSFIDHPPPSPSTNVLIEIQLSLPGPVRIPQLWTMSIVFSWNLTQGLPLLEAQYSITARSQLLLEVLNLLALFGHDLGSSIQATLQDVDVPRALMRFLHALTTNQHRAAKPFQQSGLKSWLFFKNLHLQDIVNLMSNFWTRYTWLP